VRPDSFYAVSKAAGEAIARFYADAHGIGSVCLRIGAFSPENRPRGARSLWMFATHRDLAEIVHRAIHSDALFAIVNAYSECPKAYADTGPTKALLDYAPQDNLEAWLPDYPPDEREAYERVEWRHLSHEEMLHEWTHVRAPRRR
jgi:uronate dehydrogenase